MNRSVARLPALVRTAAQRRMMSSDAHAAQEYEGMEKVLRSYFPHNHQIVVFVLGVYGTIIGGSIAVNSANKASAPKPTPVKPDFHTVKVVGDVPSVEDDAFPDFIAEEENVDKWLASLEDIDE